MPEGDQLKDNPDKGTATATPAMPPQSGFNTKAAQMTIHGASSVAMLVLRSALAAGLFLAAGFPYEESPASDAELPKR